MGLYRSELLSGNTEELTQAQYDQLTQAQKNDGKIRFITDGQGGADNTIYYVDVSVAGQAITSYSNELQIYYGSKAITGLPANAYGIGWCWAKDRYWDAVNIVLVNDDDAPYITLGFFHPSSYTIRDNKKLIIRVFYKIINS